MSNNKARKRRRLSEAQNHRCCYCGIRMDDDPKHPHGATLEHFQALKHGGVDHSQNCVVACRTCNQKRGHQNAMAFFASLRRGYWPPFVAFVASASP